MISYEDQYSVSIKADYAVANKLGGIMVWELAADDQQHSLLNAIARTFAGNSSFCGGCAIERAAEPGLTLQADECAFTTYELAEDIGMAQPTVAFWGPGQTITPSFRNRYIFIGGVVFKNSAT
jgi:glycosyl hydrolase family 18 (putative chitinase)